MGAYRIPKQYSHLNSGEIESQLQLHHGLIASLRPQLMNHFIESPEIVMFEGSEAQIDWQRGLQHSSLSLPTKYWHFILETCFSLHTS